MEERQRINKRLLWTTTICDFALLICLIGGYPELRKMYQIHKHICKKDYTYGGCVDYDACTFDVHCIVVDDWFSDSSCYSSCRPGGTFLFMYWLYSALFYMSIIVEFIKLIIALSNSRAPNLHISLRSNITDSWTLGLLRMMQPKLFDEVVSANEEGKIPVATGLKKAGWGVRDYSLTLLMMLFIPRYNFYTGWVVVYMVFWFVYWVAVWRKMMYIEKVRLLFIPPAPVVAVQPVYQYQVVPQPVSHPQTAEGIQQY